MAKYKALTALAMKALTTTRGVVGFLRYSEIIYKLKSELFASTYATQDSSALSQRCGSCFTRPIALHEYSSII